MPRHMGGESFELVLVAAPDDCAPPVIRLRHVLKALLRAYGFRCTSCRDVTPRLPPVAQGATSGPEAARPTAANADALAPP